MSLSLPQCFLHNWEGKGTQRAFVLWKSKKEAWQREIFSSFENKKKFTGGWQSAGEHDAETSKWLWTAQLQSWSTDTSLDLISTDGSEPDSLQSVLLHHMFIFSCSTIWFVFFLLLQPYISWEVGKLHSFSTVKVQFLNSWLKDNNNPWKQKNSRTSRIQPELRILCLLWTVSPVGSNRHVCFIECMQICSK